MDVNVKPVIDIPAFLQPTSESDFMFYIIISGLFFTIVLLLFFERLKKSLQLIEIKRDIKSNKISHKEAAYYFCTIVSQKDLTAIKSLSSQELLEIKLLKYKENHETNKREFLKIIDKLVIFTLLGKY